MWNGNHSAPQHPQGDGDQSPGGLGCSPVPSPQVWGSCGFCILPGLGMAAEGWATQLSCQALLGPSSGQESSCFLLFQSQTSCSHSSGMPLEETLGKISVQKQFLEGL